MVETTGIGRDADGRLVCDDPEVQKWFSEQERVSMNMWAGEPAFIEYLEEGFREFLADDSGDPLKKEYLLPTIVDQLIRKGEAKVKVLETQDKWFGITYKEDKPAVEAAFAKLIEDGGIKRKEQPVLYRTGCCFFTNFIKSFWWKGAGFYAILDAIYG